MNTRTSGARYMRHFASEDDARSFMRMKNSTGPEILAALLEGPDDGYTVCDLSTAIESEMAYEWSAK